MQRKHLSWYILKFGKQVWRCDIDAQIRDNLAVNMPQWTEYQKKNGLDPLGMQNSSVALYQTFLPGISNVTLRMRYYGLYAWLSRTYAKSDGSNDPEQWKKFLRRAEALYALVAYRGGNESGVAGIQWAEKAYNDAPDEVIDFAAAADPDSEIKYLKQAWGAYGAAYGSQLFAIGIFWESPDHILPVPSQTFGDRLAQIFDDELGELSKLFAGLIARGSATKEEIERLAPLVPSEIATNGDERALYQELLLSPTNEDDQRARSRRLSLLLILEATALLAREPSDSEVRWILYAGQDQAGRELELEDPELEDQRQRWWVYQASDLCHIALETLLKYTLDTLGTHSRGLPLDQVVAVCIDELLETSNSNAESWSELLEATRPASNPYSTEDGLSEFALSSEIVGRAGRRGESHCPAEIAWKAVQLLAVLQRRIRDEEHPVEKELGEFTGEGFQTLLTVSRFLDKHADLPLNKLLGKLIELKVVRRHLWVAARKFQSGDYTFLIEADEGRLRLRQKDGPVFTNPRLGPAITFLKDIHLIGGQGLTDYGAEAVATA